MSATKYRKFENLKVSATPPKMAPRSGTASAAAYGVARAELATPFKAQVAAVLHSLQGARKRAAKGSIEDAARILGVSKRSVKRYLKEFRDGLHDPAGMNLSRRHRGNSGRPKSNSAELVAKIQSVPQFKRTCVRRIAMAVGVPKSTIHRHLRATGGRKGRIWIKPSLTPQQRRNRLRWVLEKVEVDGRIARFPDFYHTVHLDEKWFTLVKDGEGVWIYEDEQRDAAPTVVHKSRVPKVMFIAAIGRPHRRPDNTLCDGLIGVWPFVQVQRAQRNSKNRAAGTEILAPVNVDSQAFLQKMQEEVFPRSAGATTTRSARW